MQYYGQYEQERVHSYTEENIQVTLHNRDLWEQFHRLTNEMIVTKAGRRMFPIIAVNIRGLDPEKMYTVELSFDQIDSHRWRFVSCQWQPGMKPEPTIDRPAYQHPDSPNYGRTWMRDTIMFPKVKLTNKIENTGASQVLLNSLHKYRPRISIIDVISKSKIYETSFDVTEFIAVTAYQNEEVKSLKIRHNPFAKAFLETANIKRETTDEQANNAVTFHSQASSSSGGPERLKIESYRASPYSYSQSHRKSSPNNISPYPSTSTSPFDASIYYAPLPSTNPPCSSTTSFLSDTTPYYSNSYYPPSSSYYFPYGASSPLPPPPPTSSSVGHYSFMTPFNYPLNNSPNVDTKSFLCMQPSTSMPSVDENRFNLLIPTSANSDQY
ncbi:unnamed protein product [Adineta ricciae]|uniref:T-box domain-containing protein n=1 Tax=Adineta ricciae TaxID=249248 RepID=A0A813NUT2_ADIRI|nr:unnamed protein product [Adineta ricciae]CAF1281934.1 unnamed protein product [Adineta ricciae]